MQPHEDLALAIDDASDAGDEHSLCRLRQACERRLRAAKGIDRVHLLYYWSNTYSSVVDRKQGNPDYVWTWDQPDAVQAILLLRRAISEPSFAVLDPIYACQIRNNLANRLGSFGRPAAANEERLQVLEIIPRFAKTLGSRAEGIASYAKQLYDPGHMFNLLSAAKSLFEAALDKDAFWESGDRNLIAPQMIKQRDEIVEFLHRNLYDDNYDLNQWSLGNSQEERIYRRWCLRERIFLNPLNDAFTESVAATDVLHLPSHIYRIDESPRFPAYYNVLKQEYVSARYRLFRTTREDAPRFVMRDVWLPDGGERQILGHHTEELRSAFRTAYAIFDKIGLFINDYFNLGVEPRKVTFRGIWYENPRQKTPVIRSEFKNRKNWLLRGLYFLSKDLFDQDFIEVAQPDAASLAQLRNQAEHRFLSFQRSVTEQDTEIHRFISISEFESKTLRLLKMAREALIYLSLSMHREELQRKGSDF